LINFGKWTVEIAPHDKEDSAAIAFAGALHSFLSLFPFRSVEHARSAELIPDKSGRLIVIHSAAEKTVKKYFKCLLRCAYGSKKETGLSEQRYLFIDLGTRSIFFEGLRRPIERCGIARTVESHSLLPAITELLSNELDPASISSQDLRYAIESTTFPSGAEEIQEVMVRNVDIYHHIFNQLEKHIRNKLSQIKDKAKMERDVEKAKKAEIPAVRLLLGALASGDIEKAVAIKALREIGVETDEDETIEAHFKSIEEWKKERIVDDLCKAPLSQYLKGRRILIVEDQLKPQHWNIILPILFGAPEEEIKDIKEEQKIGDVLVSYAKTVDTALQNYPEKENLQKFDIILLDLYSSDPGAHESAGHTQSDIKYSVIKLCQCIERLHYELKQNELVTVSFPRIVVFSADNSGLTTRTMIKELGATDYFFKSSSVESHKSEYYATFRNALICAFKENVTDVLGLPQPSAKQLLDKWLSQFWPAHQPAILRIMKHFRYYSAMSIVRLFDQFFKTGNAFKIKTGATEGKGCISLFGAEPLFPKKYIFCSLGRANKSGPSALALLSKTKWMENLHKNSKLSGHTRKERQPTFIPYEFLAEIILKEFEEHKKLVIVFVDDFIGSGGQVVSYVSKAVHKIVSEVRLKKEVAKKRVSAGVPSTDQNLQQEINYEDVERAILHPDNDKCIDIHVLFAVGLISEPLMVQGFNNNVEKSGSTSTISGTMRTAMHQIAKDEWCNCNNGLSFKVHIADAIPDLKSICNDKKIKYQPIEHLLRQYIFITKARAEERPCQFEPLGWKDCGGLVALYSNTPANTLPIIWADGLVKKWFPLFPRFFNPWDDGGREGIKKDGSGKPEMCELLAEVNKSAWPERAKNGNYRIEGPFPCWAKKDEDNEDN